MRLLHRLSCVEERCAWSSALAISARGDLRGHYALARSTLRAKNELRGGALRLVLPRAAPWHAGRCRRLRPAGRGPDKRGWRAELELALSARAAVRRSRA